MCLIDICPKSIQKGSTNTKHMIRDRINTVSELRNRSQRFISKNICPSCEPIGTVSDNQTGPEGTQPLQLPEPAKRPP
jgi:hypothetical protein